jgi:E3 ubiquitin-protein ligase MARCH6
MHYFRPKRAIKYIATVVWKDLSRKLRLTSYFFGENRPEEQYTPQNWFGTDINDPKLSGRRDGTFRRVPATDNLALPRDMRATARVTESGTPFDKAAEDLIKVQNTEALKAKRDINFDYRVVYIPPGFRYRIFAFILSMWTIGAVILGISVALPITLGRSVFKLFMSRDVHDGYSLILGFYLLVACYLCGRAIDRLDKRRQRRSPEGPRADLRVLVVKRGLLWTAKISYMIVTLGVLLPILVALVMDLYVILPIRLVLDPSLNPRIRIVDTWALGLLYVKIAFHAHRIQPNSRISRGLHHVSYGLLALFVF